MKSVITFTLFLFLFGVSCFAQSPQYRGPMGKDGYILEGEMSIYLKNKVIRTGEFRINNTNFYDTDVDYKDVDFIVFRNERYEFVNTGKSKPQLLKAYFRNNPAEERGRVMFYEGFTKWKPKVHPQQGYRYSETYVMNHFMKKDDMDVAVKYNTLKAGNLIKKYFFDCPSLMEIYRDKQERKRTSFVTIFLHYNSGCGSTSL